MNYETKKNYLEQLLPDFLFEIDGIMLAGGAVTSLLMNKEINDLDIYCNSKQAFDNLCETLLKKNYEVIFISNKAVTFTTGICDELPVQVMHYRWFTSLNDIYGDFDFSACKLGYDFKEKKIDASIDSLISLASKHSEISLMTRYPLISLVRIDKYKEKGFEFRKSDILKLMLKVNTLEINSWDELEDQLGGFYGELELSEDDKKVEFSMGYAMANIDRLFARSNNSYENHTPSQDIFRFYERIGIYNGPIYDSLEGKMYEEPDKEQLVEFYKLVGAEKKKENQIEF